MEPHGTLETGIIRSSIDYTTNKNQSFVSGDESVIENENELDPGAGLEEESVYPMKTIKLDKGFYTLFELKTEVRKKAYTDNT